MPRNAPRRYRVRYDRIVFILLILVVMVLMLWSCISSCSSKQRESELSSLEDNLIHPEPTTAAQAAAPDNTVQTDAPVSAYATLSRDTDTLYRGSMILVNHAHPCVFDTQAIEAGTSADLDFVKISSILENKTGAYRPYTAANLVIGLDRRAAMAMDAWLEEFFTIYQNNDIRVIAGYDTAKEDLDFSTGLTLTLGIFPQTGSSYYYKAEGDYAWIAEHAAEYGFILRYPEGKDTYFDSTVTSNRTSTFRYVGIAPATYMASSDLCLEEFLDIIKDHAIDSMIEVTSGTARYGMYYVPANPSNDVTTFSVPTENTYEISGNNIDGFIVTVALNAEAAANRNVSTSYEDLED